MNRTIVSLLAVWAAALMAAGPLCGDTLVDIPLNEQIDTGLGPAVSGYSSFEPEAEIGFCRNCPYRDKPTSDLNSNVYVLAEAGST